MSLQQSWFRESARIESLYCVLYALRRCHCNIVGSAGVPVLNFCPASYTLGGDVTATKLSLFRGGARIKFLYCFLHALRRCHCNIVGSAGVLVLNFCIAFYTLGGDVTATKLVPRECPY